MALSVLYPPRSSSTVPAVDIVAVHGLAGDAFETWTDLSSQTFWLKDFLPEHAPDARILTFGYNATAAFSKPLSTLSDHAESLLECLDDKREEPEEQHRPLIFVAHSLGGIVVKQALLLTISNSRFQAIREATIGIIFFDTPHRRNSRATYGEILTNITQVLFPKPKPTLLNALQANADAFEALTFEFVRKMPRYQIVSLYDHRLVGGTSSRLLEKHSPEILLVEQHIMVEVDHIAMPKLNENDRTSAKVYKWIKRMRTHPVRKIDARVEKPREQNDQTVEHNSGLGEANSTDQNVGDVDSMHALAVQHNSEGRILEAIELEKQVVVIRTQTLGENEPRTLLAMHCLAIYYGNVGQYEEVVPLAEKVVTARKRTLGPRSPDTLSTMLILAGSYGTTGRYQEAIDLAREAVNSSPGDKLLIVKSLEMLAYVNMLAFMNGGAAERQDEAISIGEDVVVQLTKELGQGHPSTIASMHNLASTYSHARRHSKAINLGEQVVSLSRDKLGANHPQTFLSMYRLSIGYQRAGLKQDALRVLQQLIALQVSNLGEQHSETMKSKKLLTEVLVMNENVRTSHGSQERSSTLQDNDTAQRDMQRQPSIPRKAVPNTRLPFRNSSLFQKSADKS